VVHQTRCRLAVALASGGTQQLVISSLVPWGIARTSTFGASCTAVGVAKSPTASWHDGELCSQVNTVDISSLAHQPVRPVQIPPDRC
jgi:hypothetical protein